MKSVMNQRTGEAQKGTQEGPDPKRQEKDLQALARMVQQFRIQGQRFLVGDLPIPPDELREKIQSEFRKMRSVSHKGAAIKFRLSSLEAKFNSQLDLFGKRLRGREEARRAAHASSTAERRLDPMQGIVFGRELDAEGTKALYGGLPSPSMSFDKFRSYLGRQADAIRAKTGCSEIQFRVAVQDGKLRLKAKPVRSR